MLYYIHGYQSAPNSAKGALLQEKLNARSISYRQGKPEDLRIDDCVQNILDAIRNDNDVVLIGSSLGGLLAAKVALERSEVKTLILLNPAIIPPHADMSRIKGIPERILSEMKDDRLLHGKISARITILIGTRDEVVPKDWVLDFAIAQQATVKFLADDHAFTANLDRLPHLIEEILNLRKTVA
jgi:predicted esterase YcpF (UPF0227 family)